MSLDLTTDMHHAVQALTRGFSERIEYGLIVNNEKEMRANTRHYPSLIGQLRERACAPMQSHSGGPSGPNKSGSRPPTNTQYSDILDDMAEQAEAAWAVAREVSMPPGNSNHVPHLEHRLIDLKRWVEVNSGEVEHPTHCRVVVTTTQGWVKRARIALGYETRKVMLADASCTNCGGWLEVAMDATTDVSCVGSATTPACGHNYDRLRWIDLI